MLCLFVCILALFIQHAKRIGHIIWPFVTWQAVPHYLTNGTNFGKIKAQITFWFSLQAGLKHFKYIQLHIVINVQRFSWKVWLFCEFLIQVEFFTLTFGKCSKTQSGECPNVWRQFVLTGRKALKKPVFVSINFAFALKRYIHKSSYTKSIQSFLEILAVHQTWKKFLSC